MGTVGTKAVVGVIASRVGAAIEDDVSAIAVGMLDVSLGIVVILAKALVTGETLVKGCVMGGACR